MQTLLACLIPCLGGELSCGSDSYLLEHARCLRAVEVLCTSSLSVNSECALSVKYFFKYMRYMSVLCQVLCLSSLYKCNTTGILAYVEVT